MQCGRHVLAFDQPKIMAIINLTEDSFSGDGLAVSLASAMRRIEQAVDQGADLIDLGAESTRPGAKPVDVDTELARLLPVLDRLKGFPLPVSVDTRKPEVMRAVLDHGNVDMINDVAGFRSSSAVSAVAASDCGVCVMHMLGDPLTMQASPEYEDVVASVGSFLDDRVAELVSAGVSPSRIMIDPGFGFGKTLDHNVALFKAVGRLASRGLPLLVGVSRKRMIGALTGRELAQRDPGSAVAAVLAMARGASVVRVHDVAMTFDARSIWLSLGDRFPES